MSAQTAPLTCPRCHGPAVRVVQTGELSCVHQCAETLPEMGRRLVLEEMISNIGRALGHVLPEGTGFCLVLFDFGQAGNFAYISNGQREDIKSMLRELLDKLEKDR